MNVVFEKNPLPTFLYDLRSFALHAANEAALYQYGYTEQEFLSLTLPQLAVRPQQQPPPSLSIETPDIPGGTRFRATHRRKDGTLFDVEIVSHLIRWKRRWVGLAVVIDITTQVRAARSLQLQMDERTNLLVSRQAELRALTVGLRRAEQGERQHLACALHDHIAQDLALAKIRLDWHIENNPSAASPLSEVSDAVTHALEYTRHLIYDLVPPTLHDPEDLAMAMASIATRMERRGLRVVVKDDGRPKPLSGAVLSLIMEVTQELLYNVLKHAKTTQAFIQTRAIGRKLHLSVLDTGQGFTSSPHGRTGQGGIGLPMIRERLEDVGGRLTVQSRPGKGTCVRITLPLAEPAEDTTPQESYAEERLAQQSAEQGAAQKEFARPRAFRRPT